jgi:hypothetical protein
MQYTRQRHHSPGSVGQIMDPILRRFFLSSGTQLKSGATQSLQNDHDPASDAAPRT